MKQLILYFLFFVGAAFIFIQCAKFFPSELKLNGEQAKNQQKTSGNIIDKSDQASLLTTGLDAFKPGLENGSIISYFNYPAFPFNMVKYIDGHYFSNNRLWGVNYTDIYGRPLFYNPYARSAYYRLFNFHPDTRKNGPQGKISLNQK